MITKQAILILAHQDTLVLRSLIKQLDSEYFDIFIHFDLKNRSQKVEDGLKNLTDKSRLYLIPSVEVVWGDFSVVEAELLLMEAAVDVAEYSYFHLLSGQDLALKSAAQIYNFFNSSTENFF
ncbi:beta-1,6-N-acetylglucosaminyltransferase [Leuconostoc lactis]|uniref:beta-1,6-N-acetylglucosaminyltransferase n=1 Tax=Leuconostoc lactis TaxID=1246 RepID=UPI000496A32A|nr:beta-1,6-N-acetylglucosaminyltransferase [Leuconostoc lactis]